MQMAALLLSCLARIPLTDSSRVSRLSCYAAYLSSFIRSIFLSICLFPNESSVAIGGSMAWILDRHARFLDPFSFRYLSLLFQKRLRLTGSEGNQGSIGRLLCLLTRLPSFYYPSSTKNAAV